jgi:hypothetical protein
MFNQQRFNLENQILSSEVFNTWVNENEEELYTMFQQLKYYNDEITEEQFLLFAFCKSTHRGYYSN